MSVERPVVRHGEMAACDSGHRFRLVSQPAGEPRGTVVFVQPFAEEMNKSRRMCARLARRLAGAGWRIVQRDLCGCGDSSGEFRDATWAAWVDDVRAEVSATDAARPAWLFCLRAGALLAPEALAVRRDLGLLLWQPVMSGARHLQQFLRLHAGARIVGSGKAAASSPAQALREGATVEIGGYELSPALALGMEQADFDVPADFAGRIVWLEIGQDDTPEPSPQAARMQERLATRGIPIDLHVVQGPAFWQSVEIEECDALIDRSMAAFTAVPEQALP